MGDNTAMRPLVKIVWPLVRYACTELAVFPRMIQNLILPSFSVALISCKRGWKLGDLATFRAILVIFSVCMYRNGYL